MSWFKFSKLKLFKDYYKNSNVKEFEKGLFAKDTIKKGSVIVEFKGKLLKPGQEYYNTMLNNIRFKDGYVLECPVNDMASRANEAIIFPKEKRLLMETLRSNEPFYSKYPESKINSHIKINDGLHRAYLIADCDIESGE